MDSQVPGNPLHASSLAFVENYKSKHTDFTCWLRQRNTNNRLNEGFWFQGKETYASVGLFDVESGNRSTKGIAIVFWPYDEKNTGVSFEASYRYMEDKKLLTFYNALRNLLQKEFQEIKSTKTQFRFLISRTNAFVHAEAFLNKYLPQMRKLVDKYGLGEIVISEDTFQFYLGRIHEKQQELLEGVSENEETETAEVDEEELKEEEEFEKEVEDLMADSGRILIAEGTKPTIGAQELATEFAGLINELKPEKGMLVGLFGQWGRGKTFLFDLMWDRLKARGFERVDFHAWKYQDTSAAWGYLYEVFAEKYYGSNKPLSFLKAIKLNYHRSNKYAFWSLVAGSLLSGAYYLAQYHKCLNFGLVPFFAPLVALVPTALSLYKKYSSSAKALIKRYGTRVSYSQLLGIQAEIQKELRVLLKAWIKSNKPGNRRVLLFVDDIDRCGEKNIIQVVDALRVMLEDDEISQKVVVVMAVDQRILKKAIAIKYSEMYKDVDKIAELTSEYLDKLFIAGVKLNRLTEDERKKILSTLIEKDTLSVTDPPPGNGGTPGQRTSPTPVPAGGGSEGSSDTVPDGPPKPQVSGQPVPDNDDTEEQENDKGEKTNKLQDFEARLLEEYVLKLKNATPRNIRIFYFRYLLSKNFLKRLKKRTDWGSEEDIHLIMGLITYLTNATSEQPVLDRLSALESTISKEIKEGLIWHSLENLPKSYKKVDNSLKLDIKSVLDMVVAY